MSDEVVLELLCIAGVGGMEEAEVDVASKVAY